MQAQITKNLSPSFLLSLVKRQQYMEALDRYKMYLADYPDKLPDVLTSLYKELSKNLVNIRLKIVISELYYDAHLYQDCFIELSEIYDIDPTYSQTFFLLNKLYKITQNKDYIVPIFHDAISQNIFDSVIIDILPKIYLDEQNITKSIELFEKLIEQSSTNEHYHKTLAELYKTKGDYLKAVQIMCSLVEHAPQFLSDACILCEDIVQSHSKDIFVREQLLTLYTKVCNPNKAITHLEILCTLSVKFKDKAERIYKELLDSFPDEYHIRCSYINFLISTDAFTEAIVQCDTFYDHFEKHETFIETTIKTILDRTQNHPLTICRYLDLMVRKQQFSEIKTWIDICLDLPEVPIQELLLLLDKVLVYPVVEKPHFEYQSARLYFLQENYSKAYDMCKENADFYLPKETLKLKILLNQSSYKEAKVACYALIKQFPYERDYYDLLFKADKQLAQQKYSDELSLRKKIAFHLKKSDFFNVIELCQQVKPDHQDYPMTQLIISRCFIEQGRTDLGLNQIDQLIQANLNHDELKCEALFFKGVFYYFTNKFNQAITTFEHILKYSINFKKVNALLDHIKKCPTTLSQGELITGLINPHNDMIIPVGIQNSAELLSKSAQTMGFSVSHNDNGVHYMFNQNYTSALTEFSLSLQLDQSSTVTQLNQQFCYLLTKDVDSFNTQSTSQEDLNKHDVYHLNQGLYHYQHHQLDEALTCFQKAIKLNPVNYHAIYNMAILYFKMNRLYLCFKYLEKINSIGLYFIFLQRKFHYLNHFSHASYYWGSSTFELIDEVIATHHEK
ncbi:hypothetical protein DID76_02265 [Candidatus Marinamargulisbacteria bacterium SCGC AG-414-C22]|nr:hypothetical protein DID76_02265 [Candidatus Marinamargulisbacteria bacterium SCGC AG-414-C22]